MYCVYLTLVHPGMSSTSVTTLFSTAMMTKYTEHWANQATTRGGSPKKQEWHIFFFTSFYMKSELYTHIQNKSHDPSHKKKVFSSKNCIRLLLFYVNNSGFKQSWAATQKNYKKWTKRQNDLIDCLNVQAQRWTGNIFLPLYVWMLYHDCIWREPM